MLQLNLNTKFYKLKLTFKVGYQLRTKLYTKPTDKQSYLHSNSEHFHSMKNSIAYSLD